jgi:hypothetical protein
MGSVVISIGGYEYCERLLYLGFQDFLENSRYVEQPLIWFSYGMAGLASYLHQELIVEKLFVQYFMPITAIQVHVVYSDSRNTMFYHICTTSCEFIQKYHNLKHVPSFTLPPIFELLITWFPRSSKRKRTKQKDFIV